MAFRAHEIPINEKTELKSRDTVPLNLFAEVHMLNSLNEAEWSSVKFNIWINGDNHISSPPPSLTVKSYFNCQLKAL